MQGIYSISGGYNSWRHWYQKHFGLLFQEISLCRQTVVEHFDRSLPLVLVVQGGWAPSGRFSCSYIWSMCNSWFVFLGLVFTVFNMHSWQCTETVWRPGQLRRWACTLLWKPGYWSEGKSRGEGKKDRTKSNWKVNDQPSYLSHISVRLNRRKKKTKTNQQSFTRQCKVGQCKISIIWQPVQ